MAETVSVRWMPVDFGLSSQAFLGSEYCMQ
jgi:hypothetical protein